MKQLLTGMALCIGCNTSTSPTPNDLVSLSQDSAVASGDMAGSSTDMAMVASADMKMSTPSNFAGCQNFTDLTNQVAPIIQFGGELGQSYSPKCAIVSPSQTVTFSGSFGAHSLKGLVTNPTADIPDQSSGVTASATFKVVGNYGYYCNTHGNPNGTGMAGLIKVVAAERWR